MGVLGRNDACPCGSGKKYKKCCQKKDEEQSRVQSLCQQNENSTPNRSRKCTAQIRSEINQLVDLFNAGRYVELENHTRLLVEKYPNEGSAWKFLGASLLVQGKDALFALQKAAKLLFDDFDVHSNLGIALQNLGQLKDAVASYRQALKFKPDFADAHYNLGNALRELGQFEDAVASYRRALKSKSGYAEAHANLGSTLRDLGQLEEAAASYRQALKSKPDFVDAHYNLGNVLRELGQLEVAAACNRRALEIKPDYAEAHNNLGIVLRELGQFEDALACYRRALEIRPDYAEAHNNLGILLQDSGLLEDGVACYRRLLKIKPDYAQLHSNLLFSLIHSETLDAQSLFAEHCSFGEQFEAPLRTNWPQHDNSRIPERCLQVGFVSGDLRAHAVTRVIMPTLANLSNHPQLSLHAYYNHPIEDAYTQRLREYFKHWHPISGLPDAAVAERIRADGIDILIDLSGHTALNRLLTFARKPAPIQVSWVGYPGTTGLQAMDYYLAEKFFLPLDQFASQFTEKIVHLPATSTFMPVDAPLVNALPALSNGYITWGSFNRQNKISRSVIALWAQLLRALPDSKMLLGGMSEVKKYGTLIEWFAQEGIVQDRLCFHGRSGMDQLHHQVDICLDTFPYNGSTTTLHALWMGVPTLTLAGNTPVGRLGATALGNVGLEAFIALNAEDFVQKGVSWSGKLEALSEIRMGLRERFVNSPVGQPALVAESLQRAFRVMWQRWCAGLPAESFEVTRQDLANAALEEVK